jgi:hypothetical protein
VKREELEGRAGSRYSRYNPTQGTHLASGSLFNQHFKGKRRDCFYGQVSHSFYVTSSHDFRSFPFRPVPFSFLDNPEDGRCVSGWSFAALTETWKADGRYSLRLSQPWALSHSSVRECRNIDGEGRILFINSSTVRSINTSECYSRTRRTPASPLKPR